MTDREKQLEVMLRRMANVVAKLDDIRKLQEEAKQLLRGRVTDEIWAVDNCCDWPGLMDASPEGDHIVYPGNNEDMSNPGIRGEDRAHAMERARLMRLAPEMYRALVKINCECSLTEAMHSMIHSTLRNL